MYTKQQLEALMAAITELPQGAQNDLVKQLDQLVQSTAKQSLQAPKPMHAFNDGKELSIPASVNLRFTPLEKQTAKKISKDKQLAKLPSFGKLSSGMLDEMVNLDAIMTKWLQDKPENVAAFTARPVETFFQIAQKSGVQISKDLRNHLESNYKNFQNNAAVIPAVSFSSVSAAYQKVPTETLFPNEKQ